MTLRGVCSAASAIFDLSRQHRDLKSATSNSLIFALIVRMSWSEEFAVQPFSCIIPYLVFTRRHSLSYWEHPLICTQNRKHYQFRVSPCNFKWCLKWKNALWSIRVAKKFLDLVCWNWNIERKFPEEKYREIFSSLSTKHPDRPYRNDGLFYR